MAHKILLVDDEKISLSVIKFGLAEKGYEVMQAGDGKRRWKKSKKSIRI